MIQADTQIFLFLNGLHHPLADIFFYALTQNITGVFVCALISFYLLRIRNMPLKTYGIFIGFLVLTLLGSESMASDLAKPFFERLRPTHEPELKGIVHTVWGYVGGSYGFFSAHATNSAAALAYCWSFLPSRNMRIFLCIILFLNVYSRMYLGVHYPSDILAGLICGGVWGYVIRILALKYIPPLRAFMSVKKQSA